MLPAEQFAQASLGPIANDGVANPAGGNDPQPIAIERVGPADQRQKRRRDAPAAALHDIEFGARSQPQRPMERARHGARRRAHCGATDQFVETVSRFRPLARRRFSTMRPFLVRIRTMNPWVRLRRRRLG